MKKLVYIHLLLLCFVSFFCLTPSAYAKINTPRNMPVPGGVVILPLKNQSHEAPKAFYHHQHVMVIKNNAKPSQWYAVIGIALSTTPGEQSIHVQPVHGKPYQQIFRVKDKRYPLVHIAIKDKNKVTPDPETAALIRTQDKEIHGYLKHFRNSKQVSTQFMLPVDGRFSSPYGLRRIYNKQVKGRHKGLDIAARKGTPVVAATDGKVIGTGHYVLLGNAVFIDHGRGLISYYCHLKHIDVKSGEMVKQGQHLGRVGSTGRATGPHLHWGVALNGVSVDPMLFVTNSKDS